MLRKCAIQSLIGLATLFLTELAMAAPVGTAFTYQGQLKNAGSPANGNTDMSFSLWDAASGGTQQGSTLIFTGGTAVNVTNGLFTVQLDFGVNPYTANAARWLEISVNGTPLTPRQPLTSTPFALNARGVNVDGANNVGIGTTSPLNKLTVNGNADISGNVGIGTTAPGAKLDVNGTAQMTGLKLSTGAGMAKVLTSDANGTGTWQPIAFDSLSPVLQAQLSPLTSPDLSLLNTVATGIIPNSLAESNGYAYLVGSNTLKIFTVNDPALLAPVGSIATGSGPKSVAVSDGYAYVVNDPANTLQIFNVTNPASPTLAGSIATGSGPQSVAVMGGYAYVTNFFSSTFQIFNVTNPASPTLAGSAATGGSVRSVAVRPGFAYLVGSDSLKVFDIGDPASPTLIGSAATGGNPRSVAVSGEYVYVISAGSNTLQVFNVGNPASPELTGTAATDSNPLSVVASGGYAYVINIISNTLQIFNVTDPTSPTLARSAPTLGNPGCLAVSGAGAYVGTGDGNLQVFAAGLAQFPSGAHFAGNLSVSGYIDISGSRLHGGTTGNVGIGTTSPAAPLHVVANDIESARLESSSTSGTWFNLHNSTAGARYWRLIASGTGNGEGSGKLLFSTGPSPIISLPVMTLDPSGNVGIGTSTPNHRLRISGGPAWTSSTWGGALELDNAAAIAWKANPGGQRFGIGHTTGGAYFFRTSSDPGTTGSAATYDLFMGDTGNVGIGRITPTNKLEVEGNASKTTAGSWLANSDRRIKQDVQVVRGALETLDRVRLVSFRYTDQYRDAHPSVGERTYHNVIAQEFAQVFPDYVKPSGEKLPDGSDILQVDTYPLTIYSTAAVQELHQVVQQKDAEIAELRKRIDRIEASMQVLVKTAQTGGAR